MLTSFGFRRWFLAAGILSLTFLLLLVIIQLGFPADGYTDLDGLARGEVVANLPIVSAETGLQKDDLILAINGQSIDELRELAFTFAKPAKPLEVGKAATYRLLRQGEQLEITVIPTRLTVIDLVTKNPTSLFSGGVFFLVGLIVFLRKPKDRSAQVFYLTCLGLGSAMWARALFAFQPGDLINQTPFILFSLIEYITFWLNFPLLLHLLLIFPRKNPLLDRVPWLIPVAYPTLTILSLVIGFAQGNNISTSLGRMDVARFPIAMVYLILAFCSLSYNFFTAKGRTERNQLRWIVWGVGVGAAPWLFLFALPLALFGRAWISVDLFNLVLSVIPCAFGFSIIKYRLFDIETLIHRSLVYGLLSLTLAGVYLLLVSFLTRFIPLLGLDASGPALPVVAVIVVAAIFAPAKERLQIIIDRAFYKDRLAYKQLPLQVSRELSGAVQLSSIITLLTQTIPQRLQITSAELLVFDQERGRWTSYQDTKSQPASLPITKALINFLQGQDGAIPLYDMDNADHQLIPFFQQAVEIIVPLSVERNLVGLYNLYPKYSEDYYQTEEVEILSNLGYQAAISLSNALKFQQVQQLNEDLENKAREYQTLYRQERRRATQLALINEVSREVTSILEISRLLNTIVENIRTSFDYHWVGIGLLERDKENDDQHLICVASAGDLPESESPVGSKFSLTGRGITSRVARTGQPALVKDVRQEPDYVVLHGFEDIASELTVPLTTQDGVIGVLDIVSQQVNAFDADDLVTMQTLAGQIAVAIENARLYQTQAEQERLKQELLIAQNIQANLLPLEVPSISGLTIYGHSIAAEEVGGDFYNYVKQGKGKLGIAVGDVSGKGLSGSLFMAVSITALRAQAPHHQSTSTLLESLNTLLYPQLQANRMNTAMLYAHLDLERRQVQISNAGLIAPIIVPCHQDEDSCYMDVSGLPLGVIDRARYHNQTIPLQPGDLIVMCSDGIVEAMNPKKELYGFSRLEKAVIRARKLGCGAEKIVKITLEDVMGFMQGAPQQDDMTIVAVEMV